MPRSSTSNVGLFCTWRCRCGSPELPESPTWPMHLTAPHLVADADAQAALLQVSVEHVVPAADVEDHMVARHVVPGGPADGQVRVAVDGLGHPPSATASSGCPKMRKFSRRLRSPR